MCPEASRGREEVKNKAVRETGQGRMPQGQTLGGLWVYPKCDGSRQRVLRRGTICSDYFLKIKLAAM